MLRNRRPAAAALVPINIIKKAPLKRGFIKSYDVSNRLSEVCS